MVTDSSEKEKLKSCITDARQQLKDVENQSEASETAENRGQIVFLFFTKFSSLSAFICFV